MHKFVQIVDFLLQTVTICAQICNKRLKCTICYKLWIFGCVGRAGSGPGYTEGRRSYKSVTIDTLSRSSACAVLVLHVSCSIKTC